MAEVGCLKDGHFQNLEVESGDISVNGVVLKPWRMFGMDSQFLAQNFGAPGNLAGHTTASITCPSTQLVPLVRYVGASNYIKYLQAADGSINAAQAEMLLTNLTTSGAVNITDFEAAAAAVGDGWMGTDGTDRSVVRWTNATGTALDTCSSSPAAANDNTTAVGVQTLILFDNFKLAASAAVTLNHNADARYKAGGSTIYVSSSAGSSGINGLVTNGTAAAEPANADQDTIITASAAETTILHGSFLYFNCADAAENGLHVHGVLLTSGGTIASIAFA